jgi:NitT/TauT family transport system ATP-binding protein
MSIVPQTSNHPRLDSALGVAAESAPEIIVDNVSKSYGAGKFAKPVVHDCSFALDRGKLTVMIGPSGCGKSTLIRLLAGFERPTAGTITIGGKPVLGPGLDRLVLFQETALFPWMTTFGNIMFGPRARAAAGGDALSKAEFLLDKVGLAGFRRKYPTQLSGGMQRRAELARAMINEPKVMILDEPFRGLDAMTKTLMQEYYAKLYEETRRTTFFVTTDIDEAIFLADRILVMTNVPSRVRAVLDVNLPRPRRLEDLIENDNANLIKMNALSLLHEEAMKSFARGSKAAADFIEAYSRRIQKPR